MQFKRFYQWQKTAIEPETKVLIAVVLAVLFLLVVCIYIAYVDEVEWEHFKVEHKCKKVGEIGPTFSSVVVTNPSTGQPSVVITSDGGRTGWLCDDGMTYWR